jgi:hypothetical protein
MKVYLVGNPLVNKDSLPILIKPCLQKTFPRVLFEEIDPIENFVPEEGSIIIDTVIGLRFPTWFDSIDAFVTKSSVNVHDYDLGFHLALLKKMNKLNSIRILGIPPGCRVSDITDELAALLDDKRQKKSED